MTPDGLSVIVMLTGRFGLTFIVMVFELAGLPVAHVAFEVRMQSTLSPVTREEVVNETPAAAGVPFTSQEYEGLLPPFTGTAVNVTGVPGQTIPDGLEEMVTLTGRLGFTTIVIAADVAGLPVTQSALEVRIQVTLSPLFRVVLVKVIPTPELLPFTCH